jgi:hypothetical protein
MEKVRVRIRFRVKIININSFGLFFLFKIFCLEIIMRAEIHIVSVIRGEFSISNINALE